MPKLDDIVRVAKSYVGTPFHHQGRLPHVGLDCGGLLVAIARELKLPVAYDQPNYRMLPDGTFMQRIAENLDSIPREEVLAGDVGCFWFADPRYVHHCGVFTDVGLVHTYTAAGKVVEHAFDFEWENRLDSCWRFRGLD